MSTCSSRRRVYAENYSVYGTRKVWLTPNREGIDVVRCTVERLMKVDGLAGAVRGKVKRTTIPDPAAERGSRTRQGLGQPGLLATSAGPALGRKHHLRPGVVGWVYVAFVIDAYARRILGRRCGISTSAQFVLGALEQAIRTRQRAGADLGSVVARLGPRSPVRLHPPHRMPRRCRARRLRRVGRVRRRHPARRGRPAPLRSTPSPAHR
ncbi:MAG: IS3 family transposase [Phycicoccus sp.]